MSIIAAILGLALVWAGITANFSLPNLLLGAAVAAVALVFLRGRTGGHLILRHLARLLALALLFVYELALSAVKVASLVVRPNMNAHLRPAIIAFPLTARTDAEITLLANLITLTPGTLSMDVSADRKVLYIHVLSLDDREALIRAIASGFEQKAIEVFE